LTLVNVLRDFRPCGPALHVVMLATSRSEDVMSVIEFFGYLLGPRWSLELAVQLVEVFEERAPIHEAIIPATRMGR
jgi:hypothetical protein